MSEEPVAVERRNPPNPGVCICELEMLAAWPARALHKLVELSYAQKLQHERCKGRCKHVTYPK